MTLKDGIPLIQTNQKQNPSTSNQNTSSSPGNNIVPMGIAERKILDGNPPTMNAQPAGLQSETSPQPSPLPDVIPAVSPAQEKDDNTNLPAVSNTAPVAIREVSLQELYQDHIRLVEDYNNLKQALAQERQAGMAVAANGVTSSQPGLMGILQSGFQMFGPYIQNALSNAGKTDYFSEAGKLMFEEFLKSIRLPRPTP